MFTLRSTDVKITRLVYDCDISKVVTYHSNYKSILKKTNPPSITLISNMFSSLQLCFEVLKRKFKINCTFPPHNRFETFYTTSNNISILYFHIDVLLSSILKTF